MSAIGTKRTWASALHMSAFGGKADILLQLSTEVWSAALKPFNSPCPIFLSRV